MTTHIPCESEKRPILLPSEKFASTICKILIYEMNFYRLCARNNIVMESVRGFRSII